MSREYLARVIQRSISDGAFRRQLTTDPTGALRGYDLSADEVGAIRSGDATRLTSLGVEQRMSKAFTLSDGVLPNAVSKVVTSDIGATYGGAFTTQDGATSTGAFTTQDGATSTGALLSGGESDTDRVIADASGAGRDAAVIPGEAEHAVGADIDPGASGWSDVLAPGDDPMHGAFISGEGAGGATTPMDPIDGPEIQS